MLPKDNVKAFYDNDADQYDSRWQSRGGVETAKRQSEIVNEITQSWENKNIVEIGCGSGRFSVGIAKIASSVTYIDLSRSMLKITREKLHLNYSRFNGVNASGTQIPLASGSTDAVISINMFNHIKKPSDLLKEIHRILGQKGKLLFNFTNIYSYYFPLAIYINHKHSSIGRDVYSVWSKPKEVRNLLSSCGFSLIEVVGNVFVPLHLDKPIIRQIPILLDGLAKYPFLKWLSPTLFFYCEKI